jgi:hypothetical protein
MQADNDGTMADVIEAPRGQAEPTTCGRRPRFQLIKLEERIAPVGGSVRGTLIGSAQTRNFSNCLMC